MLPHLLLGDDVHGRRHLVHGEAEQAGTGCDQVAVERRWYDHRGAARRRRHGFRADGRLRGRYRFRRRLRRSTLGALRSGLRLFAAVVRRAVRRRRRNHDRVQRLRVLRRRGLRIEGSQDGQSERQMKGTRADARRR